MISYSTNWMGPVAMWWFKENGFVDDSGKITEQWHGGRIDIYGLPEDEYYAGKSEMSLPIMDSPSWEGFSRWLEDFETDSMWSLEQLVAEYEKNHNKIRWAKNNLKEI